ncbi:acetyl-CoA acetyltransferase [Ferroplasma acidiphilum]|uniref:Acetyl-CoA acetyltransferase n=1 Tax=Ferroplasma acidiphilum TaxID=74969 RepID=A0A1V0N431_9ARCH|nr:thiolase family protein [Ferroplasma acidiphilum]ARD84861.1 acetyl-CoA acetyltransferase [Ferroplasma acidiphilum]
MNNSGNTVYIIDSKRTPIGKRNGSLKDVHPVDLLGNLTRDTLAINKIDPHWIDDVITGCVDQVGNQGADIARNSWLSAGLPESTPGVTIDRQCGSSLQAIEFAKNGIISGDYNIAIASGVESMTRIPILSTIKDANPVTESLNLRYKMNNEWFSQAYGAELIAEKYGILREDMDFLGYTSHMRASQSRNVFQHEILPVKNNGNTILEKDEGIRDSPDLKKMNQLPPAFPNLKLVTAGNSSQISDGASIAILASEDAVEEYNLKPVAKIVSTAAVGVNPVTMLTGPIPVTKKVLDRAGMKIEDIDVFEVNEAFASVVLAWEKELNVPHEKVNVKGGAVALGHPLGATGTRIVSTMVNILNTRKLHYGLIAICEGGGMANGAIIERVE